MKALNNISPAVVAIITNLVSLIREEENTRVVRVLTGGKSAEAPSRLTKQANANFRAKPGLRKTTGSTFKRAKGEKRTPEALERLTNALLREISAVPGHRIEQIAQAMGVKTSELVLPVKKLLAAKKIRTRGQKRATKYFTK